MIKYRMLAFLLLISLLSPAFLHSVAENPLNDNLIVDSPKNLAVFHILTMLTPTGERLKDDYSYPIASEAREHFASFKNHKAVLMSEEMLQQMWFFIFNYIAFYYSDLPEAKLIRKVPPEFSPVEKLVSDYLVQVRDFYTASNFEKFWDDHRQELKNIIEGTRNLVKDRKIPELLEKFYGSRADKYYIVPAPFMPSSGYNVTYEDKDNAKTFISIIGIKPVTIKDYPADFITTSTALHEFSHCFIEPISTDYEVQVKNQEYLYQPLAEKLGRIGYKTWDRAFNEHLIRTCVVFLVKNLYGKEKSLELLDGEEMSGYLLIKKFYEELKKYDENRTKYRNIRDFYPVLLDYLGGLKVVKVKKPGSFGFFYEFKGKDLFITDIVSGSVFEKEGVLKGDILVSLGNISLNTIDDLNRAIDAKNKSKEGDITTIIISRNEKEIRKQITIPFIEAYDYISTK